MKSSLKKKIWGVLAAICGVIFILSSIMLVMSLRGRRIDTDRYKIHTDSTDGTQQASPSAAEESTEPITQAPIVNPIDFEKLFADNADIYAWIVVPGTPIDYPIVQSETSEEYYLRRDYLGRPSVSGCIFTEYYNKKDFSDPNTLIYGHFMWDGTFFGSLHEFRDEDFFADNSEIIIYTPGHKLTYEIFAAYEYSSRHIMRSFDFTNDAVFESYLQSCLSPESSAQNVRDGVTLSVDDRIITLSTCTQNSDPDKRYLVQGVLRTDEATK